MLHHANGVSLHHRLSRATIRASSPGVRDPLLFEMTARTDRIDQLLRQEIGAILTRDVQDPRIGFVTITDVETAPDLSIARVWVSIIGQPDERAKTMKALERAMPFVRRELGSRIRLRRIPALQVRADDTTERGTRVLRLLAEIESGETPEVAAPIGESLPTPAGAASADVPGEGSGESRPRGRHRPGEGRRASENRRVRGARHQPRGRS